MDFGELREQTETPEVAYGRIQEAVDFYAYTVDRIFMHMKYLLADGRWRQLGFQHPSDFIRSLKGLKGVNWEGRREEFELLIKAQEPDTSNRAIAEAIGVNVSTVSRDLAAVANATPEAEPPSVSGVLAEPPVANATPEAEPPSLDLPLDDTDEYDENELVDTNGEHEVAEVFNKSPVPLNFSQYQDAPVKKYPALASPDASQREVIDLAKRLDALPDDEGVKLMGVLSQMSLPWKKLSEAVARVAGWSYPQRQWLYELSSAETQRERSRAITLATDSGPSPDPQMGRIEDMGDHIKRAVTCATQCTREYPEDPWADTLRSMTTTLRTMSTQLVAIGQDMQEATRRAYDAALSETEIAMDGDSRDSQTLRTSQSHGGPA